MKRIILLIMLFTFALFPFTVNAASITSVKMSTANYTHDVGEEFSITFSASFSGIEKWSSTTEGIFAVGYELDFDDKVLDVTAITSKYYDSIVFKDNGKYYVYSQTDGKSGGKCADNLLNCEDYFASLTFKVKKAPSTSTTVKLNELDIATFTLDYSAETYTEENIKETTYTTPQSVTIALNKSTETASSSSIITDSKPTINNDAISSAKNNSSSTTDSNKSSNKYLKSLTIKDYKIDFVKDKYTYKLYVPSEVNTLYVTAEVEDKKSTYVVTGAEDLKANNDRIRIKVTAEDGDTVTYNLIIEREEKEKESSSEEITNKLNLVVFITLGVTILITIICIIVSINNKKKLNKLLEKEL